MSEKKPGGGVPHLDLKLLLTHVANHYGLVADEVMQVALSTPLETKAEIAARKQGVKVNWVPVGDVVKSPPADMSISQLRKVLEDYGAEDEKCLPFLLRFVLGEFHYGQRVTRFRPNQQPASAASSSAHAGEPKADQPPPAKKAKKNEPDEGVFEVFNVLADESRFRHLHQVAGWADMHDKHVWDQYVLDVCNHKIKAGDRVFEGGCGVLAFLKSLREQVPDIEIGGLDGAARTIRIVKDSLVDEKEKANFFVGLLPDGMKELPDLSWDIVLCNSVFQYIPDYGSAEDTVREFLRVTRRWVIIADVCDSRHKDKTMARVAENKASVYQNKLPDFLFFERSWWNRFDDVALVSIRHVEVEGYSRRRERYCVYLEKIGVGRYCKRPIWD